MKELSAISSQRSALRWRRWLVLALLFMLGTVAVFAQEAPVVSIKVHSEGLKSDRDIEGILGLEISKPLDLRRIRQGIQILMAAGEFSWVRVRTELAENGID